MNCILSQRKENRLFHVNHISRQKGKDKNCRENNSGGEGGNRREK